MYYVVLIFIFCYRSKDIGKPKSDIAAEFINSRVKGCCVKPYPWEFNILLTLGCQVSATTRCSSSTFIKQ